MPSKNVVNSKKMLHLSDDQVSIIQAGLESLLRELEGSPIYSTKPGRAVLSEINTLRSLMKETLRK